MPGTRKTAPRLPSQFAHMERFVDTWALATDRERNERRLAATMTEIRAFYDVMIEDIDAVLAHFGSRSEDSLQDGERLLFRLTLAFAEVAGAVELYRQPGVVDGFDPQRFPRVDVPHMTPPDV